MSGTPTSAQGWTVVTGASAGIGLETVRSLSAAGRPVLALALPDDALTALGAAGLGSVRVAPLDLADAASVGAAAELALGLPGGVRALVNNAGVALVSPSETLDPPALRRLFDVNFFGAVELTRRLLPALIGSPEGGRVVNVSSMLGRMSLPFAWPYCATKHAVEAWSAGLRMELHRTGVKVCVVRAGAVNTAIWAPAHVKARALLQGVPPERLDLYHKILERVVHRSRKMAARGLPPARVAGVIVRALRDDRPRRVYRVGGDAVWYGLGRRVLGDGAWERLTLWRLHADRPK